MAARAKRWSVSPISRDPDPSALAGDHWFDPRHEHGVYGGDGRGPIADGEERDGYHWDFTETFSLPRSLVGIKTEPAAPSDIGAQPEALQGGYVMGRGRSRGKRRVAVRG